MIRLNIYSSVLDINNNSNSELVTKWNLESCQGGDDLKVIAFLEFLFVLRFKDNRDVIKIDIASEYRERGIQNELSDIVSLKKNH